MIKNAEVSFLKVSAAGNRFLISEGVPPVDIDLIKKIQSWCHPETGFGVDGCLWLEKKNASYVWHFYNSDGSTAEMCGNAACSAVYFLHLKGAKTQGLKFETVSGIVDISEVTDSFPINFAISLQTPKFLDADVNIKVDGKDVKGPWIDSGVPHIILEKTLTNFPTEFNWERKVRNAPHFHPRGTNVTYVDVKHNPVRAISYERGVENYTAACGTGALATAYFIYNETKQNPITVEMPGGQLKVTFEEGKVTLQSPVFLHGGVQIFKD